MPEDTDMPSLLFRFCRRCALTFLVLAAPGLAAAATSNTLTVSPSTVLMDTQFNGTELTVNGSVPAGAELLVRVVGEPSDLHLREKGKVFGLLWMNVGKVNLHNVPGVCLLNGSLPLAQLGKAAQPYRLEALTKAIGIEQEGGDPAVDIPHELLLLKTKEGLYRESAEGITMGEPRDGMRPFTAHIRIPSSLKPGEYRVEALALKGDAVIDKSQVTISAALTGFPKWLSELAYQKSALYGVMATVIAIVSGLVIGLVFQSKGAH